MRPPRKPRSKTEAEFQAMTILACDADLSTLRVQPDAKPLSKAERRDLLQEMRSGQVVELVVDATVYRQSKSDRPLVATSAKEANSNFTVFRAKELPGLTRSFKRRPVLRDHARHDFRAVGGEIIDSKLEEEGDWYEMRQVLHLVKSWVVEAALDGTLRTFSIGWDPKKRGSGGYRESIYCTVCSTPMFASECNHWPGDLVEFSDDAADRVLVEMEWRGVRGAETSAVMFPAVEETAVEEIRAALAEVRADEQTFIDEVKTMDEKKEHTQEEIAELEAQLVATKEALAEERAERAREAKERHIADVAALREKAIGKGLFEPESGLDESFHDLAGISLEKAQKFIESLKPRTPVGALMQSTQAPAGPDAAQSEFDRLCDTEYGMNDAVKAQLPRVLKQLGLTETDFVNHGQHTRWAEEG